ncbi:hypothetical protein [Verrucomicrobium sp. BvORR106]|uniref:hypothetical protein n=1 Tax=Verrucomicrobium sp. BvORR106 TaxID=1403819 RepID=UPI000AB70C29|nr:hypothetical protein [Verrucomicrobium sp. BvORR106]
MKRPTFLLVALSVLAVTLLPTRAELPPTAYIDMQAKAPEVFQIKVDDVSSKPISLIDWSKRIETVQATVQKVTRTKSDAKPGDKITISYERLIPKKGWAGPSPAPPLEQGKEYPAYLEKTADGTYKLGARGKSFTEVK